MAKRVVLRVTSILLGVLLLVYIGYQIYRATNNSVRTEYALDYTYYDSVTAKGYFIRQELLVQSDASGIVNYEIEDGGRVAQGGVIAEVYQNEEQAKAQLALKEVNQAIENLTALQSQGSQYTVDAELLTSQINERLSKLLSIASSNRLQGLDTVADELLTLLNKKQMTTGQISGFQAQIDQLNSQKQALQNSLGTPSTRVTAPQSGFFVSRADGYENLITPQNLEGVTAGQIRQALENKSQPAGNVVGKIVTDYDWYIACILSAEEADKLTVGNSATVSLPLSTSTEFDVTISEVNNNSTNGEFVAIVQCNSMNSELSMLREESVEIRLSRYTGLRVNSSALRVVEGVQGVYVLNGIEAKFKQVDIQYADTDFVICLDDGQKSDRLKRYDEVIVEGNDLYDGKVVK